MTIRHSKWMLSVVSLLLFLPLLLPLLCAFSFLAFIVFLPLCCPLLGLWSWRRLRKPATATGSIISIGEMEGNPLRFLLVKSGFVKFLLSFVLVSQLTGLIEWTEMKGGEFEGSNDGCRLGREGETHNIIYGNSDDIKGGTFKWYNPLANIFNAEVNKNEMDWSESDGEITVSDHDMNEVKPLEGSLSDGINDFRAEVCTVTKFNATDLQSPSDVDVEDAFDGHAGASIDFHGSLLTAPKEIYSTLSCREEEVLFSEVQLQSKDLELIHAKCEENENRFEAAYEMHAAGGQNEDQDRAEECKMRNNTKSKGRGKICSRSALRAPTVGNNWKKSPRTKKVNGIGQGVGGVASDAAIGSPDGGQSKRGLRSAEAGQSEVEGTTTYGQMSRPRRLGVKRTNAEKEIACTMSSAKSRQAFQDSKSSDSSRRVKPTGVEHTNVDTICKETQKGGMMQDCRAMASGNHCRRCHTGDYHVDSRLASKLDARKHLVHASTKERRPPSTGLDHGNLCATDQTYSQFYRLLEFWRRTEQAAIQQTTSTSPRH